MPFGRVCNTRHEILRHRLLVLWISVQNKCWSSLVEVLLTTLVILYRQGSSERRVYELRRITAMFLLVEWRKKLRSFTNAWPLSPPKSMGKLIVLQWPG